MMFNIKRKSKELFPLLYDQLAVKKRAKYIKYLSRLNESKYPEETKKQYFKRTGKNLDFHNVITYTEKMQYSKMFKNDSIKTYLSDKYEVRKWVKSKIGEEYLIPLLGKWESFEDIEFNKLPEKFVLKTNHGSGTNLIIENKYELDYRKAKKQFKKWLNTDYSFVDGIQPHYRGIQRKILAEEFIQDSNGQLNDYKFLCFNGKVYYCWIDIGRFNEHYRNTYDLHWNLQPWNQNTFINYPDEIPKPENFDEMIMIAYNLCQGFSHVRVDLYNVNGKIYFGEMTFTSASGFSEIYPEEYNYEIGNLWDINEGI